MKEGFRIWEIQEQTRVPREVCSGILEELEVEVRGLDLENKTYAIRIGKKGLQ